MVINLDLELSSALGSYLFSTMSFNIVVSAFFRIIHENGYTHEECLSFVPVVHNNTIQSLVAIVQAMGRLRIDFGHHERVVSVIFNKTSV